MTGIKRKGAFVSHFPLYEIRRMQWNTAAIVSLYIRTTCFSVYYYQVTTESLWTKELFIYDEMCSTSRTLNASNMLISERYWEKHNTQIRPAERNMIKTS